MLISVVIPAYNEALFIGQTIIQLKQAITGIENSDFQWEIIVCNNNSTDNTASIAAELGATVVFESINQISRARNTGARAAKGDWLIFLDADSYPTAALLRDVLTIIKSEKYIGCGTTIDVQGGTLLSKLRMERMNPWYRFLNFCGGVFLPCEKAAFEAVDGFSLGLYAYEELDFVRKLKRYGKKQGKKFTILHKNPVITSGRKGETDIKSLWSVFISSNVAFLLFLLHFIFPVSWMQKVNRRFLGYWYKR